MSLLVATKNKIIYWVSNICACENIFSIYLVLAMVFWIINFIMVSGGNNIISFPVHHDDYTNLTLHQIKFSSRMVRPVTTIIIAIFASLGSSYYIILNMMTILYPVLVIYFLYKFFDMPISVFLVVIYGIFIFSFPPVIEYTKYTGMMANLLSSSFGLLSMILLLKSHKEERAIFSVLGVIFFILSIFSKEDFILPCLLIMIYFIVTSHGKNRAKLRQAISVFSVLILCSVALYINNKYIAKSPFTSSNTDAYAASFSISSILSTIIRYSKIDWNILPLVASISVISLLLVKNPIKIKICFAALALISIILPYTVLPNHVYDFYTFNWFPFGVGVMLIYVNYLLNNSANVIFSYSVIATLLCLSLIIILKTKVMRETKLNWYKTESAINKKFIDFILLNKKIISDHEYVGIIGTNMFSPWSNTDGRYLINNLKFINKWIVFVNKSDIFYQINSDNKLHPSRTINVLSLTEVSKFNKMLFIYFDSNGNGSFSKTMNPT
jgi:hypothetical protein